LMAHDRVEGDRFLLTQELLAAMLGLRRPTVSKVMAGFQRRGLLEYRRGHVVVVNRSGLEAAACICYAIIAEETERLLGSSTKGAAPGNSAGSTAASLSSPIP